MNTEEVVQDLLKSVTMVRPEMGQFGAYLLSDRRTKRITDSWDEGDSVSLSERLKTIYEADFEIFMNELKNNLNGVKAGSGE